MAYRMTFRLGAALGVVLVSQAAAPCQTSELQRILMRTAANYRAAQQFRCETEWTRRVGDKEFQATVTLAVRRPNLFRLSAYGAYFDVDVASDGSQLTALRPSRQVYTRSAAPQQIMGSDILKGISIPAPATRLMAVFLSGRWQDRRDPLVSRLHAGELAGMQAMGDQTAHVIKFDYDADYSARVYIADEKWALLRVALYRRGEPEIVESVKRAVFDADLSDEEFRLKLPSGAVRAQVLPAPEEPKIPTPMTVETVDGRKITLSDLRGSFVLVTLIFTTCPYCNEEALYLQELYPRVKALGLEIIAVNGTGEPRDQVKQWAEQNGITFPVGLNRTSTDFVKLFNVSAYPTNLLFNKEGRLIYRGEGFDPEALVKKLAEEGVRLPALTSPGS